MLRITSREKWIIFGVSITISLLLVFTSMLIKQDTLTVNDYIFFALVITTFPLVIIEYLDSRWKKAVDERLPDLFRTIVQAQQTGMTLSQSLEEAAKRDYGELTPELKKMVNQMSWSFSFEQAFKEFGRRVNTSLIQRTLPMFLEAAHGGGRVEKVFAPMGKFIQTTLTLEKERKSQNRPYLAIIYAAFYVFLLTVVLLFKTFFIEMESSLIAGVSVMTAGEMWEIFFHMSLIQAFFGGLVAGKMSNGTIMAGLKHSIILMTSGYIALKFLV